MIRFAALAALALGCGSPAKPAARPAVVAAKPGMPVGEAAPDLSPVKAPGGVIGVVRIRDPKASLERLRRWTTAEGLDRLLLGDRPELVDESLPSERVLALRDRAFGPPELAVGFSYALRSLGDSLERLRNEGANVRQLAPGVFSVGDIAGRPCYAALARGKAAARLVCAGSREDLEALAPYLTRGLPERSLPDTDYVAELSLESLRARYGQRLRMLKPLALSLLQRELRRRARELMPVIEQLGPTLYDEGLLLLSDIERVSIQGSVGDHSLDVTSKLEFGSTQSATLSALVGAARSAAALPDDFWRMPADAQLGYYVAPLPAPAYRDAQQTLVAGLTPGVRAAIDKPQYEPIRGYAGGPWPAPPVARALAGRASGVARAGAPPALSDAQYEATTAQIFDFIVPEGPRIYLRGSVPIEVPRSAPTTNFVMAKMIAGAGWQIMSVAESFKSLVPRLDAGQKAYNDGRLRKLAYFVMQNLCPGMPEMAKRPVRSKLLPAGSVEYIIPIPAKLVDQCLEHHHYPNASTTPDAELMLTVVPDGARTLIGMSAQRELLYEKLAAAIKPKAETATLKSRSDLSPLNGGDHVILAGFVNIAGLVEGFRFIGLDLMGFDLGTTFNHPRGLGALPNRGETPVTFRLSLSSDAHHLTLDVHVPDKAITDLTFEAPATLELDQADSPRD